MNINYDQIPLGITKDNEIAFAEITLRENNEFSMSTCTISPLLYDYHNLYIKAEYMYDRENCGDTLYADLLDTYDCRPSELIDIIVKDFDVSEIIDNSLYPEEIKVGEDTYIFESCGCGQQNLNFDKIIDENVFKLIDFWKAHHLSILTENEVKELNDILDILMQYNLEDYCKKFLEL